MNKYLIAIDLDGTLLVDPETMSPVTKEYLKTLKKDGHKIVIATGRPFRSAERFYNELELDTPIINYNGGLVTSRKDKNFKPYSLTLKKEDVYDIFNNNAHLIENAFTEVEDDIFLWKDTKKIRPLLHYFNGATLSVGNFEDILKKDPNGFLVVCHEGMADEFEAYIKERFNGDILSRNWGHHYNYVVEIFTPETNKGEALRYVSDYLGFKQKDIIAFGDAHNDIEMLAYANHGVAMKNAQDRLKVTTEFVTEYSNQEDGLVHYLTKFLSQK